MQLKHVVLGSNTICTLCCMFKFALVGLLILKYAQCHVCIPNALGEWGIYLCGLGSLFMRAHVVDLWLLTSYDICGTEPWPSEWL